MIYNDILRSLRFSLDISDNDVAGIISLSGHHVSLTDVRSFLKKEDDDEYIECSAKILGYFLDGLIVSKRGKREEEGEALPGKKSPHLTNNDIMKKLRIAFNLKEEDMLAVFNLSGFDLSKGELSALFRQKGHKHFRECGDQILRNFLKGLALKMRNIPG